MNSTIPVKGFEYDHIGGDLNSKITQEARDCMDEQFNNLMTEYRKAKSSKV